MGLFSTVLHVYKSEQADVVTQLSMELREKHGFSNLIRLTISNPGYESFLDNEVYSKPGAFYLVTQPHGNWTTIIELDVNIENGLYLYELANILSKRLKTYTLSFHLHDDDVLYYNLEKEGQSLDGYNSDYQYFLTEPADKKEVLSQRHSSEHFAEFLSEGKKIEGLTKILNEGYWEALDNGDLDEDGLPNDDKYFVDELDRFERIGKYLEIYSTAQYPFANWYPNLGMLSLDLCYVLKAER